MAYYWSTANRIISNILVLSFKVTCNFVLKVSYNVAPLKKLFDPPRKKSWIRHCFTGRFVLVRGCSCLGVCPGVFCLEGFVRGGFCPSPCQNTSVTTQS